MVLNGCGRTISGAAATPKTLNSYLTNNGGYAQGDLFIWGSVAPFGLSYVGQTRDQTAIRNYFSSGHAVILNVNNGGHWVLMTGSSGSSYLVNDPGFSRTSYTSGDVVLAGVFKKPAGCSALLQSEEVAALELAPLDPTPIQEFAALFAQSEAGFLQME